VLAVNVAEEAPAGTVTDEGTVNTFDALLESTTAVVLVADCESVTVQVVVALEARVADAHCSEVIVGRAVSERVAGWDEPFKVAVTVAVWSVVKAFAVARNVPVPAPAGMVSEVGTVRLVELEVSPAIPPPDPLRVTVQVLEALGARVTGLQAMELIVSTEATNTVPPVPVTAIASPVGEEPRLLLTVNGASVLPAMVTDTVATTPSAMVSELNPHATQV
jgi:hypothetical protein